MRNPFLMEILLGLSDEALLGLVELGRRNCIAKWCGTRPNKPSQVEKYP